MLRKPHAVPRRSTFTTRADQQWKGSKIAAVVGFVQVFCVGSTTCTTRHPIGIPLPLLLTGTPACALLPGQGYAKEDESRLAAWQRYCWLCQQMTKTHGQDSRHVRHVQDTRHKAHRSLYFEQRGQSFQATDLLSFRRNGQTQSIQLVNRPLKPETQRG